MRKQMERLGEFLQYVEYARNSMKDYDYCVKNSKGEIVDWDKAKELDPDTLGEWTFDLDGTDMKSVLNLVERYCVARFGEGCAHLHLCEGTTVGTLPEIKNFLTKDKIVELLNENKKLKKPEFDKVLKRFRAGKISYHDTVVFECENFAKRLVIATENLRYVVHDERGIYYNYREDGELDWGWRQPAYGQFERPERV